YLKRVQHRPHGQKDRPLQALGSYGRLNDGNGTAPARHKLGQTRTVTHLAGQLAASRVNIITTRLADGSDDASIDQPLRKRFHTCGGRSLQPGLWKRIERNEVELAGNLPCDIDQLASVFFCIVYTVEHYVLKGDEITRGKLQIALARSKQLAQGILAVERNK